jgi:hypothetical protein
MRVSALAAVAALAASVACNNTPTSPNIVSSSANLVSFVTSVKTVVAPSIAGTGRGGTVATLPGGPTVTVTGSTSAANSGANIYALHGSSAFSHIFVFLGSTGGTITATGFYQVDLTAPATDVQIVAAFGAALPTKNFDLQFQVSDANNLSGGAATVSTTVVTDTSTLAPSVLATYNPSPAPFLGGVNCVLSSVKGCFWEFSLILQEQNGVGVPSATLNETFTFGATVVTGALNITIPAHGTSTITRNFACGTGGTACATAAQLAGGTYSYTITGTDSNLNGFTMTGPVLILSHQ